MKPVLLLSLLAVFAMVLVPFSETTLSPDAEVEPVFETGPEIVLTLENVAALESTPIESERPERDDFSQRDEGIETALTTNETSTVGRGRGTAI